MHIDSNRMTIRPYTPADAEAFLKLLLANKHHLNEVLADWILEIRDLEGALNFIEKMKIGALLKRMFAFGVWVKPENELAGEIILFNSDPSTRSIEVGSYSALGYEGRKIATEGRINAMHFAFLHLNISTIVSHCAPENIASIRVNERIGLNNVGTTNKGYLRFQIDRQTFEETYDSQKTVA